MKKKDTLGKMTQTRKTWGFDPRTRVVEDKTKKNTRKKDKDKLKEETKKYK